MEKVRFFKKTLTLCLLAAQATKDDVNYLGLTHAQIAHKSYRYTDLVGLIDIDHSLLNLSFVISNGDYIFL